MTTARRLSRPFLTFIPGLVLLLACASATPCLGQGADAECSAVAEQWSQVIRRLEGQLNEYSAIQKTSADRFSQSVDAQSAADRTIARRIADVLRVKEDLLNAKRRECRDLMGMEEQLFSKLQDCLANGADSRNKDSKKVIKQRNALIEKAILTLSEVKEVEGKETALPYTEAMRGPRDPYGGNPQSYWQNYQQMYRRWWGY